MKHINLIIFDLDGTLVDSQEAIAEGINFALQKVGLKEKSVDQIASYIGIGVDDLVRKSLGQGNEHLLAEVKLIFENYRRTSPDSSCLYPQVKETLEYFRQERKVVVTNGKHEFALLTLKKLGIDGYFEEIIGGDDARCRKPLACPLDKTIDGLKIDKEKTIMVGDMDIDVYAGKNAGILTCAVTYGIGKQEDIIKAKPDFIIDKIADLKKIIKS